MSRTLTGLLLQLVLLPAAVSAGPPPGPRIYYDYAPVIAVEPLYASERVPVTRERCDAARSPAPEPAGDVRAQTPRATLADTIRGELARREPRCRQETEYALERKIVGYEVRYRYGDAVYVRRMDDHPGERVRVRVELSALR